MINKAVLLVLFGLAASVVHADNEYDPDGFHDCILEHVKSGMGKHAVATLRKSCAHRHGTDALGDKPKPQREPFSVLEIPEGSLFDAARNSPEYTTFTNTQIVEHVRRTYYPDKTYGWVKNFLFSTSVSEMKDDSAD